MSKQQLKKAFKMSDYFFNGKVQVYTQSTDHATLKLCAKTELSFIRKARKLLRQYEPEAKLRYQRNLSCTVFILDRHTKVNDLLDMPRI